MVSKWPGGRLVWKIIEYIIDICLGMFLQNIVSLSSRAICDPSVNRGDSFNAASDRLDAIWPILTYITPYQ